MLLSHNLVCDINSFLWYGRKRGKGGKGKKTWGENEEVLGGIGLFGHVARISKAGKYVI